ncbi:zinc-binding dehydrogenase [Agrococcus jejuensis]|uniref:L-idonate 5-dehydrogenase n=1 Tax=Agrococcus jejuensis TaxID=399736 RepID=A0A1G8FN17_9MICO|nr:zinc-binding dehydrogenase [Agrococcus jejuensis]SDH83522.1 L-idonate 5-dehydrogenase [Agrococcus jejuensis]
MASIAVVAHAASDVRVEEVPEPTPAADEAVVAVAYGGICGSDLHYWQHGAAGESILREPMVLGHEVSGVVAVAAADGSGPAVGTPVTVHPATPDSYLGSAARLPHQDGAFATHVALPTRMLRPLPVGLDLRTAALAEPAAVAWHGVGQAGDVQGLRALVIGSGPIGALAVAVLRHHGAAEVVASDLHELPMRIAREVGADRTIDARDAEALAAVEADVVIESSGTLPGLHSAIRAARRGGTVVMLGLQRSGEVAVPIATAITRELRLVGSFRFVDEIDDVVAALADGSLAVAPVITHVLDAAAAVEALDVARDASASSKVLLRFAAADTAADDDPRG